jgi:alkanesulfonate monooxygenase SsuD/methylene tetrahydromethanopterin reductase-like flavin-dependent oxidoreductase (luciferase family)
VKFLTINLLQAQGALGEPPASARQALAAAVSNAVFAETLGIDAVGIGEHHQPGFYASAPTVVLAAIAARTSRVRLVSTVTVLSLLDPVRVAEDFATLDNLSDGRVDLIIGKGNTADQNALFGVSSHDQWVRNAEKYELLRRLLREENVTWSGSFCPPLVDATILPRPLQKPPRVWHGTAANLETMDLAARFGDPVFFGNIRGDLAHYSRLAEHYRERWEFYGRVPGETLTGAGTIALHVAPTSQQAIDEYRPVFEEFSRAISWAGGDPIFSSVEDAIERGSALVGSPQQVIDKVHRYARELRHEVQAFGDSNRLPEAVTRRSLELFSAEVAPVLRRELPSRPWHARLDAVAEPEIPFRAEPYREPQLALKTH